MIKRPLLRYHGSKFSLSPWIIGFFPEHKVYIEPFGGGGSVLLQKRPAKTEIYNDMDGSVVNLFRIVRDRESCAELIRLLESTPFSRVEYQAAYDDPKDDIDAAYKLCVRSFKGMSSKGIWQKSGFDTRVNPDGFISRVNAFRALPDVLAAAAERLVSTVIENDDAIKIIERHDRADALIYCDPPYVRATRGSSVYKHDMKDDCHIRLAETLHKCVGMVVLSGYPSVLYDDLFQDWMRIEKPHVADTGKKSVEVVWLNQQCAERQKQARLIE